MIGLLLCAAAFVSSFLASRHSLQRGLVTMLFWGYFWGILRANVPVTASYFLFDSGLLGFYAGQGRALFGDKSRRIVTLKAWTFVLLVWPCALVLVPYQPPLVSLLGLRTAVLFLPLIMTGAMLTDEAVFKLGSNLAILNLIVLAFAFGEYVLGVPRFLPENASTFLIYASNDVDGFQYLRIPGTFQSAHVFGSTMVLSLPFIYGSWSWPGLDKRKLDKWKRALSFAGMSAALLGVMMSATRLNFVIAGVLVVCMVIGGKFSFTSRAVMIGAMLILAAVATTNERFGRFKSLQNTDQVAARIHGSVNSGFWEVLNEHPMGNGLGGGGTNIPVFLEGLVRKPVAIESEYGRILLETGIIGLALWTGFIVWFIVGSAAFAPSQWRPARRVAWVGCIGYFGVGFIGMGIFTSVPASALMLLSVGWVAVRPASSVASLQASARFAGLRYSCFQTNGEGVA